MTTGVLPWETMRTLLNLNTGFFETSQYTMDAQMRIIAGNWDGAGVSAGNLQLNYGPADRLSELWNHMLNNHESVVIGVFGADTERYNEFRTVNLTYTRLDKIAWGETITDPNNEHQLLEPWKTILGDLMVTPECMTKYFEIQDAYYTPNALDLFKQLSCNSRAALASLFDININKGRYYPCNTLVIDFDEIDSDELLTDEEKEAQKIYQINVRGNEEENALNDASTAIFLPRRMGMANQGGDYFGSLYDPETQFDINQEIAIQEKASGNFPVKLGELDILNIYLGEIPIQSLYSGANLVDNAEPNLYYTSKVPNTQFRTNPNSYAGFEDGDVTLQSGQKLWIDVQNFVACRTYYTTDGSTPTENSAIYHEYLTFTESCILKVLNVSVSGISEAIRTLNITIPAFAGWRYVRYVGHGDQTGVTSRLVELQALEGVTNRLLGKTPISGEAPSAGTIGVATDGAKVHAAGYPLWWLNEGIPDLKYDLGAPYMIDTINVTGYSPTVDPRTTQFKIYVSTDNSNWILVTDYSTNATNQPEAGFDFTVPASP